VKDLFLQMPGADNLRDLVFIEAAGQPVAFGRVRGWQDDQRRIFGLSGFVRPEWRRQGLGQRLLAWLEARARALAAETPGALPAFLRINTTQYQVGLQALVQRAGYGVKESWVLMVRPSLEDIPEAALPAGLELRPYRPEQLPEIWYAVCEAYVPVGGAAPSYDVPDFITDTPNFQPELWQVAWEVSSGKVVGSVMTYINHAENQALGILRGFTEGISTVPAWQRRGVATALIYSSLRVQRAAGLRESALVCSGENPNNYRLYASCGFQEIKRDTVYEKEIL
jgi:GNAT superfamily N-acetyltransferase